MGWPNIQIASANKGGEEECVARYKLDVLYGTTIASFEQEVKRYNKRTGPRPSYVLDTYIMISLYI